MANYGWMLDAIFIIAIAACACVRGVKGLYKSLMPLAVVAASVILATFLSAVLTKPVTELVYPSVEEKLIPKLNTSVLFRFDDLPQEKLDEWTLKLGDLGALTSEVEEMIPQVYRTAAQNLGLDLKDFLKDAVDKTQEHVDVHEYLNDEQIEKLRDAGVEVKNATQTALDSTTEAVRAEGVIFSAVFSLVHRLTSLAVHYVLWGVFCVGLMAALTIIKNTFGLAFKLPIIGWVDKIGGAVLGAAECCVCVFIFSWITKAVGFPVLQEIAADAHFLRIFLA